jgi:hypothetical protein
MSEAEPSGTPADVGEYCRRVEYHLTRVNGGHLVRIVGPGFDLVRRWAEEAVPLSIVFGGIDRKAERHRHGKAGRPLRIEFCEIDVRAIFEDWRRAVGVFAAGDGSDHAEPAPASPGRRRPSLAKHVERAALRLEQAAARPDCPPEIRRALTSHGDALVALGDEGGTARGAARDAVLDRLEALDEDLLAVARRWADADLAGIRERAEADLAPYRDRLDQKAWDRSVQVTISRLLRQRLGLPTLTLRRF